MQLCYLNGSFTKMFSKQIILKKPIDDNNLRLIYGDYKKLYIIDTNDMPNDNRNLHNITKTEYIDNNVGFYYYYSEFTIYPYLHYKSIEEMNDEPVLFIKKNNWFIKPLPNNYTKSVIVTRVEKIDYGDSIEPKYFMTYYLSNRVIENIKLNKREFKINTIIRVLIQQKLNDILENNDKSLSKIINTIPEFVFRNTITDQDQDLLLQGISLYNYQLADVKWINKIEEDVLNDNNKIKYQYTPVYGVLNNEFLLHNSNLFPNYFDINTYNTSVEFKYYGGNIISEVGLGKTLIMLYHILNDNLKTQDFYNRHVEFTDTCNYFYKRGKNRGDNCLKRRVNDLYCKEHSKSIFIDKRSLKFCNLQNFDIRNYIYVVDDNEFIKTNASIIICPNHLCDQWIQEYYSKFKNKHRMILVVTSDQYDNLTFGDLLFADVVIISYNFLLNKRYKSSQYYNLADYIDKQIGVNILGDMTNENKLDLLNSTALTFFDLFYWNRIVLDEVHEIQNMPRGLVLKTIILNLKSIYRWNISGTPFANNVNSFINLMGYLSDYGNVNSYNGYTNYNLYTDNMITLGLDSNIIDKCNFLFRRNTKESIKDEYSGNIIRDFIHKLKFTNQERSIYDSYVHSNKSNYYNFLIKLCCHPELNVDTKEMIRNCKTFDEIQKCMLDYNKTLMEKEMVSYKNANDDIKHYEEAIAKLDVGGELLEIELELLNTLRNKLNTARRQHTIHKKNYDAISRTFNYLKSSIENLRSQEIDITCPICLDDIDKDSIAITKCGHKFCWDCIYETHKAQTSYKIASEIKCPTCNSLMKNTELYLLKECANDNTITDLDNLINDIKSTKIGNIIYFLKESLKDGDKVILFSQWDEILKKIGTMLIKQKIKLVYCSGTVYQKKRAINNFCKNKDINIILLSSRNAASGINLTQANKIILLEPIYGSKEYRYDIESQAVGRADRLGQKRPIDIHRFIIKDTVEEDILNDCVDDAKFKNLYFD